LPTRYKLLIKLTQGIPTVRDAGLYLRYEFGS
jgi:hypothetical protein